MVESAVHSWPSRRSPLSLGLNPLVALQNHVTAGPPPQIVLRSLTGDCRQHLKE